MSDPVQCFMLEVEAKDSDYVIAQLKTTLNGVHRTDTGCPMMVGRLHRAEVAVPPGSSLSNVISGADDTLYVQLPDSRIQLCCMGCGQSFKSDESEAWSSHAKWWYTNPVTGKQGSSAYAVASPGAIYECPWLDEGEDDHCADLLSDFYHQSWRGQRLPLAVVLPDYTHWVVDQKSTIRGSTEWGPGWSVTGQAPNLTAHPSIDAGTYHGWLQNGVLSADTDGRTYPVRP
jgi:hypothetical protein